MDKINYINYFSNPEPNTKKTKVKKTDSSGKSYKTKKPESFEEIFNDAYTENVEDLKNAADVSNENKIEYFLKEIGKQGERLKKTRTLEDLDAYKKMIKEYLTMILNESETIEKKNLWDPKKKQKISKVHLQMINKELLELTRIFFSEQQNTFAIASKIDRIEGLLIDLRS